MPKKSKEDEENMDFQVSLKIILKNKKGEVLLLKAVDGGSMAGYYDFPGGRIKKNEIEKSLREAIKREVSEEIGDKIKFTLSEAPAAVARHYLPKRGRYLFWIFFEAKYRGGAVKISDEHSGYLWVKLTKGNYRKYFVRGALEGAHNYLFKKFL
jgi:8-oxo-dGTP pyrophosphatase MutT (NUDIX family)